MPHHYDPGLLLRCTCHVKGSSSSDCVVCAPQRMHAVQKLDTKLCNEIDGRGRKRRRHLCVWLALHVGDLLTCEGGFAGTMKALAQIYASRVRYLLCWSPESRMFMRYSKGFGMYRCFSCASKARSLLLCLCPLSSKMAY